jgi:putative RecB family exonuclease
MQIPDSTLEKKHISVSEIREFMACPLRWWYRYGMGLWTDKQTSFFALGTSVHAGLASWYEPFGGGKQIGDLTPAIDAFKSTYAKESATIDWTQEKDKNPISESALGEDMLKAALLEGDDWTASAVERTFMADIEHSRLGKLPIKLKSVLDMVTKENDVVEHKTADRKWEAGREHGDAQATAYVNAIRQNHGHDPKVTFNIISKHSKGPNVERRVTTRTQDDIDQLYITVRAILDAREKGAIYPNPTAFVHSSCEYRRLCNQWESHPQKLPETKKKMLEVLPGIRNSTLDKLVR